MAHSFMNWPGRQRLGMEYMVNAAATGIKALSKAVVGVRNDRAMFHICGLAPSRLP